MKSYITSTHFEEGLNLILEETDLFSASTEKLNEIDATHEQLTNLDTELRQNLEQINGRLATAVRRQNHNLEVWLDRTGKVRVKYGSRTRSLRLTVDPRTRSWVVGDSPFETQFAKYNHEALKANPETLAKAIATYFKNNYKSMRLK